MTNYMKKIMMGVAGALLLVTPVLADEACKFGTTKALDGVKEAGAQVSTLSDSLVKVLVEKKGPPPGVEGDFAVERIDMNGMTALIIVQGECINQKIGPVPSEMIDNFLGLVNG